mgnify:FL=1
MTVGKLFFWGGITGFVLSLILFVVVLFYLKNKRKKIQENLEKNY